MFDMEAYRREQAGGNPDRGLLVSFFVDAKEQPNGEYKNVEMIKIFMSKNNEVIRPVTEEDRKRFSDRYEAWQKKEELPPDGTPIGECNLATPANIASCKAEMILTCEQLVETPDERLQRGQLVSFKYMVRDWLKARGDTSYVKEMRAELEAQKAQIEALKEKFRAAGLPAPELETNTEPVKKKRGRPRKKVSA